MTQARTQFASFAEYLSYSDELEGRYELIDGELVEAPPESEPNNWVADNLKFLLTIARLVPRRLIKTHACEIQVPVLHPKDAANRFPDLVVLRPEHLELTQRRLTITLDMPPPRLIAEVISPGKTNRDRDYSQKRAQYAAIGVSEYWLIDLTVQAVLVLTLEGAEYQEVGLFGQDQPIDSREFAELKLSAGQLFREES